MNNGIQLDQVPKCIKDTRVKSIPAYGNQTTMNSNDFKITSLKNNTNNQEGGTPVRTGIKYSNCV